MGTLTNLEDVKRALTIADISSGTLVFSVKMDDTLIQTLIEDASDIFSRETKNNYYAALGTLTLDVTSEYVHGRKLFFKDDVALTLTRIENDGNGTLTAADWVTMPRNTTPIYGVQLKTKAWTWTDSNLGAIKVIGTIGTALDGQPPSRVHLAVTRLASWLYQTRDTRGSVRHADRTVSFSQEAPSLVQTIIEQEQRLRLYS